MNMKGKIIIGIVAFLTFTSAGLCMYSSSLEAPFLFDSSARILENPHIRIADWSFESLKKAAFDKPGSKRRPLTNITFAINYYFDKYDPLYYHVVNIIIHSTTGLLLFLFLVATLRLYRPESNSTHLRFIAFLSALIWFTNPLHTQSVTYIVQRANSMAAMFYLLAFFLYIQGRQSESGRRTSFVYYALAAISWILSLGCKQNAAMLPFFILLYEWYFFQDLSSQWIRRRIRTIGLFMVVILVFSFIFVGSDPIAKLSSFYAFSKNQFTYMQRVLTQPRVVLYYVSLFIYPNPNRLNIDYDYPLSTSIISPVTTLLSIIFIIAALGIAIINAKKHRLLSFSIFWYFGNLLLESSIIPLDIIFEHRTYLPTMLITVTPVFWIFTAMRNKRVATGLLLLPAIVFSYWTFQRNLVWSDKIAFWQDCVDKSPQKARPHFNLGAAYAEVDEEQKAMAEYKQAIALDPDYAEVYNNIGAILAREGRWEQAEMEYRIAIDKRKGFHKAHYNLAVALRMQKNYDEAIKHLNEAIYWNPYFAEAYMNLGIIFDAKSDTQQALHYFQKAIDISPNFAAAHSEIGRLYAKLKDMTKAELHLRKALSLDPTNADALFGMGNISKLKGEDEAALAYYRRALSNAPHNADVHLNLGHLLFKLGQKKEAEKHYREALRIDDELVEAHVNLGGLLEEQGQLEPAIKHYKRAIDLDPAYANAYNNLGNVFAARGDYASAIANFKEAIRLSPTMDEAHVNYGIALLYLGDEQAAAREFRLAQKINPANRRAQESLKALMPFASTEDIARTEEFHQRALEQANRGNYEAAVQLFKQIIAVMPSEPGTCYNIACMYAKMGDSAAALEWLERAIQNGYDNWDAIENDPDLNSLRQTEGFKALLKKR